MVNSGLIKVDVTPIGAVRLTQRGKWTSTTAKRYLNYKKVVGYQMRAQCKEPAEGAVILSVTFNLPMPESWSGKKRKAYEGQPVTVKPDVDNLVKGVMDAANGILWKDDNQVTDVIARKRYAYQGGIELQIEVSA